MGIGQQIRLRKRVMELLTKLIVYQLVVKYKGTALKTILFLFREIKMFYSIAGTYRSTRGTFRDCCMVGKIDVM